MEFLLSESLLIAKNILYMYIFFSKEHDYL